jgi:hypothetical protein
MGVFAKRQVGDSTICVGAPSGVQQANSDAAPVRETQARMLPELQNPLNPSNPVNCVNCVNSL